MKKSRSRSKNSSSVCPKEAAISRIEASNRHVFVHKQKDDGAARDIGDKLTLETAKAEARALLLRPSLNMMSD